MIVADEVHYLKAHDVSLLPVIIVVTAQSRVGANPDSDETTHPSVRHAHAFPTEGALQSAQDAQTRHLQ